jgi:hypothetical protein
MTPDRQKASGAVFSASPSGFYGAMSLKKSYLHRGRNSTKYLDAVACHPYLLLFFSANGSVLLRRVFFRRLKIEARAGLGVETNADGAGSPNFHQGTKIFRGGKTWSVYPWTAPLGGAPPPFFPLLSPLPPFRPLSSSLDSLLRRLDRLGGGHIEFDPHI